MEIWKDIKGYEGKYQVSNQGRVKSLNYNNTTAPKILSLIYDNGYCYVGLSCNSSTKKIGVHRLVADAFIPNPENKPCINHINTVRDDNNVENLEWCTIKENNQNYQTLLNKRNNCKLSKPIIALQDGIIKMYFPSTMEAQRMGFRQGSVSRCARGERNIYQGYKWQYMDDYLADWWEHKMEKGA